jgi:hypothetical protein
MGGAPVVETIRPGVQFTPPASASFRRLEARLGRRVDVNSTYRDWDTQMGMYNAWNAYVAGRGPKPPHSRAIHPSVSIHCQGNALDSDDWRTPGFNALAAEYGWIRTAAGDPTEQHHFEYQVWNDKHRNEGVPAGSVTLPKKKRPTMYVIRRKNHPSGHTYVVESGRVKHLPTSAEAQAILYATGDTKKEFDELDTQRFLWGCGLTDTTLADLDYLAGERGGTPGGQIVALWRDAGKIPR